MLSRSPLPTSPAPAGWAHLAGLLGADQPAFALDPVNGAGQPTADARALSALLTLPAITVATAVRDTLVAQGLG